MITKMYKDRIKNIVRVKSRESGKTIVIRWQPLSKYSSNIIKEQRLVNTFLPSGVEEDELPRVRDLFKCASISMNKMR